MRIALVMRDCGVHSWTSHEKKMQRGHCRPAEKSSAIKNNNDEKTRSDRLPSSDLTTAFGHTLNAQSLQKPCTKSLLERRAAGVRNGARMETKNVLKGGLLAPLAKLARLDFRETLTKQLVRLLC